MTATATHIAKSAYRKRTFGPVDAGDRSYRVALGNEVLLGFEAQWDVAGGASRCRVFEGMATDRYIIRVRGQTRLQQNDYLLQTRQVDKRWLRAVA